MGLQPAVRSYTVNYLYAIIITQEFRPLDILRIVIFTIAAGEAALNN